MKHATYPGKKNAGSTKTYHGKKNSPVRKGLYPHVPGQKPTGGKPGIETPK
jgi:hypothetical protein